MTHFECKSCGLSVRGYQLIFPTIDGCKFNILCPVLAGEIICIIIKVKFLCPCVKNIELITHWTMESDFCLFDWDNRK